VDVEEGDAIALSQWHTVDITQVASDSFQSADRDVARDEGVRRLGEASSLEMDVGAADLAELDAEKGSAGFELW
jgi:hypothetical protein